MSTLAEDSIAVTVDADAYLRAILAIHFEPRGGSPYWLERRAELGFDPREEIRTLADLHRLGPFDESALRSRATLDLVPGRWRDRMADLVFCESSGTTGSPKRAAFHRDELVEAFVASFRPTAEPLGFPQGRLWLYVGPSGPHPIGRGALGIARSMASPEPFTVDFDPRWVRKLPEGSFARQRYMEHLLQQAQWILERESIGVLFSTPPVLLALSERMGGEQRERIGGVHFGGMEVTAETRARIAGAFPAAVLLSGYGNSMFGVALQAETNTQHFDYFPWRTRHVIRIVPVDGELHDTVAYGEEGRVVMSRLDPTMLVANLVERDLAVRIPPSARARALGCLGDGVRDPHPPRGTSAPRDGFY